tara:strand:- start:1037 stop:1762 length:726 start_codon:yes stop_codon:yes gene_type:complete
MDSATLHNLLSPFSIESLKNQNLIFFFSLPDFKNNLECVLSSDELEKQNRYRVESAKQQFYVTRTYLRYIMAHFLDVQPKTICLKKTAKGKLYISNSPLTFNVSHSHTMAAIAVSILPMIGIDLEYYKPAYDYYGIVKRFFTHTEQKWLLSQPLKLQNHAFFNIWTGKEAVAKATGLGLSYNLSSLSIIPNKTTFSVSVTTPNVTEQPSQFFLDYISLTSSYSCCIAMNHILKKSLVVPLA